MDLAATAGRPVDTYGSRGLSAAPVVGGSGVAVTVLELAPGGEIGRHPAPTAQVLVVLRGTGTVSGEDGRWQPIVAGQAVTWSAGEEHGTRAVDGMRLLVVEHPGEGNGADHGTADGAAPSLPV